MLDSSRGRDSNPRAGLTRPSDFEWVALRQLEILLVGTDTRLRFPHPALTCALVQVRIGLKVMDIGALCRTYNILAAEGRKMSAAALIKHAGRGGSGT